MQSVQGAIARRRCLLLAIFTVGLVAPSYCQTGSETFTVNSPVQELTTTIFDPATHPNGIKDSSDLQTIVKAINTAFPQQPAPNSRTTNRPVIIHLLRWADSAHTQVKYQYWYLSDPHVTHTAFYFESASAAIQHSTISGQRAFRFVYIHLDSDLTTASESFKTDNSTGTPKTTLTVPVNYQIQITKKQTQLAQDIQTLIPILTGGVAAQANAPELGYYSVFDFNSQFSTSSIVITAALPNSAKNQPQVAAANQKGATPSTGTAANNLASQTYANERPAWVGLGAAVPMNSYKDISYHQTSTSFTPATVNRQNVYVTVDFYLPPSEPGLTSIRWVPHPFFGLPLKGQPLKNTAAGFAIGAKWLSPFAAVVFNEQQRLPAGATAPQNRWVRKGAFGLEISLSALSSALSSKSSGTSTTTTSSAK
jgi:hypothetical protein